MIGWRDIPPGYNHRFAWGIPEERDELEDDIAEINALLEEDSLEESSSREELERRKADLQEKLRQERQGMEYQDGKLRQSARAASEYRQEEGMLSPEEAQRIDGFYYVHSQLWYPILTEVSDFNMSLQEISENSLTVSHAADAYPMETSKYIDVTAALREPLSQFVAVGSRGSEDDIRKRVEE
ncbi:MAG: hypothetical protein SVS85_03635, partial [Candidatus Nanohaloarchaea archaeon]|nr:hypothetical protein [Candidatus Nanohaloarchaea archaeon]